MKNKRNICILLIFLVFMITISAVNAAEDVTSDLTSMEDNEEINLEENILNDENENLVLEEKVLNDKNEEPVEASDEEARLSETTGTFTDLNNDINGNNNTEITLNKNYTFNPDSDSDYQIGIKIKRAVTINGNGMTIDGNNLSRIFYVSGKNVIIKNINFVNTKNDDLTGGAIFWEANDGSLSDCSFINNSAYGGGAIMWYGTNAYVSNCTFINNSAVSVKTNGGGAILLYGANFSISNCSFENNYAKLGGAIQFYYTEGTISDSIFINNTASQTGGAIYTEEISGVVYNSSGNKYINIFNCSFEDNHADMDGGAIGMYFSANCTVSNSNFINNTADDGGAIFVDGLMNNSVSNSKFTGNKAESDGGAIYWISDNGSVSNCEFTENHADNGGAIYWFFDSGTITDSVFTNNTADSNGGALDGKSNAINCNFTRNKATRKGGAMNGGNATNCVFTLNNATGNRGSGGGINQGNAINCTFTRNHSGYEGGGLSKGNAINCNFTNNTANYGGGIDQGNAINCNFTNNKAYMEDTEPGDMSDAMYKGIAVNCNFTNNTCFKTKIAADAYLDVSDYESTYDSGEPLKIKLLAGDNEHIDGIQTKITIYQNGVEIGTYYAKTGDGWEVNLSPGEYNATISIEDLPEISPVEVNLKISKASTEISTYDAIFEYGTTRQFIVVTLRDGNGKTISGALLNIVIDILTNPITSTQTTDQNGEIRIAPRNLGVGLHSVLIAFNETENYSGSSNISAMTIIPSRTMIDCEDLVAEFNSNAELVITLYDSEAKAIEDATIIFDLNGEKNYTTDNKGKVKVPAKEMPVGKHIATIRFDGNENYNSTSMDINVTITQCNPTLTVTVKDVVYGENATAIVTLLTREGNTINGTVNLTLLDQSKEVTVSNGEGSAEFGELNAGNYTVLANYNGDENYTGSTLLSYFNVEKRSSQIVYNDMTTTAVDVDTDGRVGEYFTITLKDSNGKALANKKVQIGFNGKIYDRTTDANGEAKLQINLQNAGIYTFAISFLGDENYNGSFAVAKITVNKQKGSLTVPNKSYAASAKTKSLTATFKSASGKVVANKKISFTVNGKTYTATTNAKGVATVKVSLNKKGTYKVTAKFAGTNMYTAITKTAKLTIK